VSDHHKEADKPRFENSGMSRKTGKKAATKDEREQEDQMTARKDDVSRMVSRL
jgi:hypothetical protein